MFADQNSHGVTFMEGWDTAGRHRTVIVRTGLVADEEAWQGLVA